MMRCAAIAVLLLSTAQVCVGGKFSKFTTCEDCVAAGYGWSASKGKCGGYSTKTCAAAAITEPAAGPAGITLVICQTTAGVLGFEIHPEWAPLGAARFLELVRSNYFKDVSFYRAVPKFLAQFGISGSKAMNEKWSDMPIKDDPSIGIPVKKGTLSFAGKGPDTRTSKLFIPFAASDSLGKAAWETPIGRIARQPRRLLRDSFKTLDSIHRGYGDIKPFGRGPDTDKLEAEGNAYLKKSFPRVDYIKSCAIKN